MDNRDRLLAEIRPIEQRLDAVNSSWTKSSKAVLDLFQEGKLKDLDEFKKKMDKLDQSTRGVLAKIEAELAPLQREFEVNAKYTRALVGKMGERMAELTPAAVKTKLFRPAGQDHRTRARRAQGRGPDCQTSSKAGEMESLCEGVHAALRGHRRHNQGVSGVVAK